MSVVLIVLIVFAGLVLSLAVVGGTILMSIRLRQGGLSKKDREQQMNEAEMIQEIYNGLSNMEKRIDALETILMDRQGKEQEK
jgi:phage shock protein B